MFRLHPLLMFVAWILLSAVIVGLAIAVSFSGVL
jgi:hypothetical protein